MKYTIVTLLALVSTTFAAPKPGFLLAAPPPLATQDTQVVRDALGNQATSYAYQDGHSSAVALSRNDVSKYLAAVPAPAPVVYSAPAPVHYAAGGPSYPAAYGGYGYGGYGYDAYNYPAPAAYPYYY